MVVAELFAINHGEFGCFQRLPHRIVGINLRPEKKASSFEALCKQSQLPTTNSISSRN